MGRWAFWRPRLKQKYAVFYGGPRRNRHWRLCTIPYVKALRDAERDIDRLKGHYQTILDATREGVLGLSSRGQIRFANGAAERILGYEKGALNGLSGERVFCFSEQGVPSAIALSLSDGQARSGQVDVFLRKDGEKAWVEYACSPWELADEAPGCLVLFRDISKERHAEADLIYMAAELETRNWELADARDRALASSRTRTRFMASVSHELRTPLNAILGMTGLLQRGRLDEEQRELIEIIHHSGQSLLTLINDLLDFTSLEEAKLSLHQMSFEVWRFLEECVGLFSSMAKNAGLELICVVDPKLPPSLVGDPHRLRQILTNLLGNAIKFTAQGHVCLKVDVLEAMDDKLHVRFEVQDTGIGISTEDQSKLFKPFVQADQGPSHQYGGTGLGLAISRQLAELMGGSLDLRSEVGKGSCFGLDIVMERSEGPQSWQEHSLFQNCTVDLAMEDGLTRESLENCLKALGVRRGGGVRDLVFLGSDQPIFEMKERFKDVPLVRVAKVGRKSSGAHPEIWGILQNPVRLSVVKKLLETILAGKRFQEREALDALPRQKGIQCPYVRNDAPSILVVDDAPANLKLLQALLWEMQWDCQLAQSGERALEILAREPFDLVLMDCQMPGMDGFETVRRFRDMEKPERHTIIVAVTANVLPEDRRRCLDAGMDDFLPKPIEQGRLLELLKRHLPAHYEGLDTVCTVDAGKTDEPVLDERVAGPLRKIQSPDGESLFVKVATIFMKDLDARVNFIRTGLESASREAAPDLAKAAHALRGSSANIGLKALANLCHRLEKLLLAGRMEECRALADAFMDEVKKAKAAMASMA